MFWSASTGGFYLEGVHGKDGIPQDAIEVTAAEHAALLTAQSAGLRIGANDSGQPVAVEPLSPAGRMATLPEAERRAALRARLADLRWRRETGGVEVAGPDGAMTVDTSRDSQAMLTGAALAAQLEGEGYEVRWKALSGWVTLTGPQVLALAQAVRTHVQAAFNAEEAVGLLVETGEITTLAALEAAWAGT